MKKTKKSVSDIIVTGPVGIIVVGLLLVFLMGSINVTSSTNITGTSVTPILTSMPTETPIPTKYIQLAQPTIDPDPFVNCNFKYNGTKWIRKSECSMTIECEIGDKWYLYTSNDKCDQDQETYWSSNNPNKNTGTSNNSDSPTTTTAAAAYPPCTINYPYSGPTTYNNAFSPEACKKLQDNAAAISVWPQGSISNTPQPTSAPDYHQANQACKEAAINAFNAAKQNAQVLYGGGNSAGAAIIQIAQSTYNNAVVQCDSQYPI